MLTGTTCAARSGSPGSTSRLLKYWGVIQRELRPQDLCQVERIALAVAQVAGAPTYRRPPSARCWSPEVVALARCPSRAPRSPCGSADQPPSSFTGEARVEIDRTSAAVLCRSFLDCLVGRRDSARSPGCSGRFAMMRAEQSIALSRPVDLQSICVDQQGGVPGLNVYRDPASPPCRRTSRHDRSGAPAARSSRRVSGRTVLRARTRSWQPAPSCRRSEAVRL